MTIFKDKIFNVKQFSDKGYNSSRSPPLLYINCYSSLPSLCEASHKDGWGEGFEQREISTSDGNIYVHFWEYSNTYYIKTEEELKQDFEQGQGMQPMQGM